MKFAALIYGNTVNLGDEIQSLAAMRFLPKVDAFVDRDGLGHYAAEEPVAVILNGWYGLRPESWPPSEAIHPLLTSMHFSEQPAGGVSNLSASEFFLGSPAIEYLHRFGPVGARDLRTLELLERRGVPAYFSGCLTLTLPAAGTKPRGGDIVLNDVPEAVTRQVLGQTTRRVVQTQHNDPRTPAGAARLDEARSLLELYETAHCVITTRLHCALPCLAFGTPVLFLNTGRDVARLVGLLPLLRHATIDEYVAGAVPFDLEQPPSNGDSHQALRDSLAKTVEQFVAQMANGEPPRTVGPVAELRFQTLAHLHGEQRTQLARVQRERAEREARVQQLEIELRVVEGQSQELRHALTAGEAERAKLTEQLTAAISRSEDVRQALATADAERARLTEQLTLVTARLAATPPLRHVLVDRVNAELKKVRWVHQAFKRSGRRLLPR